MNRPKSIKENESIIHNPPKQKATGPEVFTGEFYQLFKEEMIPSLSNLFQKIGEREYFLNHSMRPELQ